MDTNNHVADLAGGLGAVGVLYTRRADLSHDGSVFGARQREAGLARAVRWRALLVWAPVTGLAIASVWLNAWYWMRWTGDGSDVWMLWASSAAWWASLALLSFYAALAVWFPKRSLHDWLAGTYLVPR